MAARIIGRDEFREQVLQKLQSGKATNLTSFESEVLADWIKELETSNESMKNSINVLTGAK
jgi:hypothetical protein